ncbi:MAG: TIGR04076 family protein [Candidatus Hadarchaeum sp.]
MPKYRLTITVKEIRGKCPVYKVGDKIIIDDFYIDARKSKNICMHALSAMLMLIWALAHGHSAKELGIGEEDEIGYLQCPDPGPPHTKGGTVLFEIQREAVK